ncbi:porin family protein [Mucilaginibacter myungsuensis]|uniref:PorT family protein n=1 Tax=Mucilaginibacter myungsuensis TaxID=649104 RepID=A0A929KVE8_9SPHI|nr:porin family protein [Mucilaginibacter myungsuensis]MBE9661457.1 PorT family protein [Mucilaginibacter myungsuensis]MDN3597600.1 porin family protein [Mucilaginibacter myungsuensis]
MKKLFFSLVVACVATVAGNQTFAQASKARVGLTAGLNLTTMGSATAGGLTINYDYRPGFQGGIFAEIPVANKIAFVPAVLYSQKGGNINTVINGVTIKGDTRVNYIDVPLLVDFKVNPAISLFVGPQAAFFMSQKSTATLSMGSQTATNTSTSSEGARKVIVGANLGAGYKFNQDLGIKLHYITDFQHTSEEAYNTGEKNSGFALTVGYLF